MNDLLPIIGGIAALLVGVTLGLLGGGGSILTVPVLVYLFGISATQGTGASLLVVGTSALVAAIAAYRQGDFDHKSAIPFVLGSVPTVFAVRAWLVPAIPKNLGTIGSFPITRDLLLMVAFAILMLVVAFKMLTGKKTESDQPVEIKPALIFVLGVVTGLLAGLVGAGGGFMIVPALVVGAGLGMKKAVGTSLGIISVQSLAGFVGALPTFDQSVLGIALVVCALALIGVFVGRWLSKKIDAAHLRPAFAWFVLVMGVFVLVKEFFL